MFASFGSTTSIMSVRLSAQVRGASPFRGFKFARTTADKVGGLFLFLGDAMEFLDFLKAWVTGLSWGNPTVLGVTVLILAFAFTRRFFQIFMLLGTMLTSKAIEFYYPQAMGGLVGDMTVVQILYIDSGIVIAITIVGQMVMRH